MKDINFVFKVISYFILLIMFYSFPCPHKIFFLNEKDGKLLRKELYLYPSLSHFKFMFKNFDQKIL